MNGFHSEPLQLPDDSPLAEELFELLQTIAVLTGELGFPPTLTEVGKAYGCSRQWVHEAAAKLRERHLLEDAPFARATRCLILSHNGRLLMETALDAGLKE